MLVLEGMCVLTLGLSVVCNRIGFWGMCVLMLGQKVVCSRVLVGSVGYVCKC